MLNNTELKQLRELRIRLLHYWQKFPKATADKQELDTWQNLLDKIILKEAKRISFTEDQNNGR